MRPLFRSILALLALAAFAAPAAALPLFSRDGAIPCARCHAGVPRLSAEGVRFLERGYRLAGDTTTVLGAHVPFSVLADMGATFTAIDTVGWDGARGKRNVGEFRRNSLALAAGGALQGVSFLVEARLDSTASTVTVPVAYAQLDDLAHGAFALRAGVWDAGLPFLSAPRRASRAKYLAPVAVPAQGVELNGVRGAWGWGAGVIDSQRQPTDAGTQAHSFNGLEDVEVWTTRVTAGAMLGARALFDHQPSDISFHAFLQRMQVQVGACFGDTRWQLIPAYTLDRFDDRPAPGIHQRHQYVLLEARVRPDAAGRWEFAARAEHGHVTPTVLTPGEDHDREVVRLAHFVTPNARIALECAHTGDNLGGPHALAAEAALQIAY